MNTRWRKATASFAGLRGVPREKWSPPFPSRSTVLGTEASSRPGRGERGCSAVAWPDPCPVSPTPPGPGCLGAGARDNDCWGSPHSVAVASTQRGRALCDRFCGPLPSPLSGGDGLRGHLPSAYRAPHGTGLRGTGHREEQGCNWDPLWGPAARSFPGFIRPRDRPVSSAALSMRCALTTNEKRLTGPRCSAASHET